ncbi:MAG: thermonuclease family protein [Sandaracinaceae bacterium]|nr:thermonuclease family protein [Sandaracinaceae bacterium]
MGLVTSPGQKVNHASVERVGRSWCSLPPYFLIPLGLLLLLGVECGQHHSNSIEAFVVRVTDGDTMVVKIGEKEERVRLIGVDAPEKDQVPWGERAKEFVESMTRGRTVRLEFDVEPRDRYGRLLAYVYVDSTLLNLELLKEGLAMLYTVPPNVRHVEAFRRAQKEARENERGIWDEEEGLEESPSAHRKRKRTAHN